MGWMSGRRVGGMNAKKAGGGALLVVLMLTVLLSAAMHIHPQPWEAEGTPGEDDRPESTGSAIWEARALDVVLQMAIILAGAFGVLSLVKGVAGRDR